MINHFRIVLAMLKNYLLFLSRFFMAKFLYYCKKNEKISNELCKRKRKIWMHENSKAWTLVSDENSEQIKIVIAEIYH